MCTLLVSQLILARSFSHVHLSEIPDSHKYRENIAPGYTRLCSEK